MKKLLGILEWFMFVVFYALFVFMIIRTMNYSNNNILYVELLAGFFVIFLFVYPFVYMLRFFFQVSKIGFIKYVLSAIPMMIIVFYVLSYIFKFGFPRQ